MGLFRRLRGGGGSRPGRAGLGDLAEGERHLTDFARSRRGVEAYVEPQTTVTAVTVLLVAGDGEWTRRRVPGVRAAHTLAGKLGIPAYDAAVVGYPQRMRDYNRRQKEQRAQGEQGEEQG
ncbi:hypothetical protein GCM10010406_28260 [Streptomyces thermolineatus]|uniref:Oxidoreductase n=1 Tax=Streptomyces thermolineatus TaxID=44033 RepID=A0ABP5Z6J1_9ACTN